MAIFLGRLEVTSPKIVSNYFYIKIVAIGTDIFANTVRP